MSNLIGGVFDLSMVRVERNSKRNPSYSKNKIISIATSLGLSVRGKNKEELVNDIHQARVDVIDDFNIHRFSPENTKRGNNYTKEDLKMMLRRLGYTVSGTKPQLYNRLSRLDFVQDLQQEDTEENTSDGYSSDGYSSDGYSSDGYSSDDSFDEDEFVDDEKSKLSTFLEAMVPNSIIKIDTRMGVENFLEILVQYLRDIKDNALVTLGLSRYTPEGDLLEIRSLSNITEDGLYAVLANPGMILKDTGSDPNVRLLETVKDWEFFELEFVSDDLLVDEINERNRMRRDNNGFMNVVNLSGLNLSIFGIHTEGAIKRNRIYGIPTLGKVIHDEIPKGNCYNEFYLCNKTEDEKLAVKGSSLYDEDGYHKYLEVFDNSCLFNCLSVFNLLNVTRTRMVNITENTYELNKDIYTRTEVPYKCYCSKNDVTNNYCAKSKDCVKYRPRIDKINDGSWIVRPRVIYRESYEIFDSRLVNQAKPSNNNLDLKEIAMIKDVCFEVYTYNNQTRKYKCYCECECDEEVCICRCRKRKYKSNTKCDCDNIKCKLNHKCYCCKCECGKSKDDCICRCIKRKDKNKNCVCYKHKVHKNSVQDGWVCRNRTDVCQTHTTYGSPDKPVYKIALYNHHFFPFVIIKDLTSYAAKHLDKVIELKNYNKIIGKNKKGSYMRSSNNFTMNSLLLVKILDEGGYLPKIGQELSKYVKTPGFKCLPNTSEYNIYADCMFNDDNSFPVQEEIVERKSDGYPFTVFFDTETYGTTTKSEKGEIIEGEQISYQIGVYFLDWVKPITNVDKVYDDLEEVTALYERGERPNYIYKFLCTSTRKQNCCQEALKKILLLVNARKQKHPLYYKLRDESGTVLSRTGIYNKANCVTFIGHNVNYDLAALLPYVKVTSQLGHRNGCKQNTFVFKSDLSCNVALDGHCVPSSAKYVMKCKTINSCAFISGELSGFSRMFKLPVFKALLPYDFYTESRITDHDDYIMKAFPTRDRNCDLTDFLDAFGDEAKSKACKEDIMKNKELFINPDGSFKFLAYSGYYCMKDVELLMEGFLTFRNMYRENINKKIDILNFISMPSVANYHNLLEGCFLGTCELSDQVASFVYKCYVGGKTMCSLSMTEDGDISSNSHVKWHHRVDVDAIMKEDISDSCKIQKIKEQSLCSSDANSLYPAAMAGHCGYFKGFIKGKPKPIIPGTTLEELKEIPNITEYFVEVLVTGISRKLQFPIISNINNGSRTFSNDLVGTVVYLDSITLAQCEMHQGYTFELIQGIYFNEGYNTKVLSVYQDMFNTRKKFKELENPIESVFKLNMNSGYGYLGVSAPDSKNKIIKEDCLRRFLVKNRHKFTVSYPIKDVTQSYMVELNKSTSGHLNRIHQCALITAASKGIMNEPLVLAESLGIQVYYMDTDSIHLVRKDYATLCIAYREKYNRELHGEKLGQFSPDFKDTVDGFAIEAYYLAKKMYIECVYDDDDECGKKFAYNHCRMKGIPTKMNSMYKKPMSIYRRLYQNESLEYEIVHGTIGIYTGKLDKDGDKVYCHVGPNGESMTNCPSKVRFKRGCDFRYRKNKDFTRVIELPDETITGIPRTIKSSEQTPVLFGEELYDKQMNAK